MTYDILVEVGVDGWFPKVPKLPGCHTQGRNMDELMERTKEASLS